MIFISVQAFAVLDQSSNPFKYFVQRMCWVLIEKIPHIQTFSVRSTLTKLKRYLTDWWFQNSLIILFVHKQKIVFTNLKLVRGHHFQTSIYICHIRINHLLKSLLKRCFPYLEQENWKKYVIKISKKSLELQSQIITRTVS